ncbi:MAG: cache and HAMP domain-containing protein, partial [bacterium]
MMRIKKIILNIIGRKLWVQIALILILLVTIPVALLGILLIHGSQEAVKKSVLNNHQEIVARAAREIELFIKQPEEILLTVSAMLGVTHADPWEQETVLVELILNQQIFLSAASADLSGREIASSQLGKKIKVHFYNDALLFIEKGKVYKSPVKINDNQIPYMTIAVPIRVRGAITGMVTADINIRGIWDVVDNIKLDKTGRAYLVSSDGTVLAHQDKKKVLTHENLLQDRDVREIASGSTGSIEIKELSGKLVISSFAPIPYVGWGIILRQEQSEAYFFSHIMKIQSWAVMAISELIAVIVSIFLANIFARPIKSLASRIRMVSMGDLEQKVNTKRFDELGELIRSFNDMIVKLKKARARERLSVIGETTSRIAHEFKNSLVPVKLFTQLFPQRHNEKNYIERFNKVVPAGIEHCERIIKDLSSLSSHSELHLVNTDIKRILDNILDSLKEKFN